MDIKQPMDGLADDALSKVRQFLDVHNILPLLSEKTVETITMEAFDGYDIDCASLQAYYSDLKTVEQWIDLLPINHNKGRANIKMPWFVDAAHNFASQVYPEIIQGSEVVRPQVIGAEEGSELSTLAQRHANLMNYQNLVQNRDWENQTDKLLFLLPLYGCLFRKRFMNDMGRQETSLIFPRNLVVHVNTDSLITCPRVTELLCLYPYQIERRITAGHIIDYDYRKNSSTDKQEPVNFLEQHTFLDLDGDGIVEPYVLLLDEEQRKLVRITPRYTMDSVMLDKRTGKISEIVPLQHYVMYSLLPDLNNGFYSIGLLHFLGNIMDAANTITNQLIDAGTAVNNTGGFLARGAQIKAGINLLNGRQYQFVDTNGADLASSIYHLPVREPSATLYQLLGYFDEMFHRMASTSGFDLGRIPSNMGEMAALQMLEQGLKSYMGIFKRIYRALKDEFTIQQQLNAAYPPAATYQMVNGQQVNPEELELLNLPIIPAADPKNVANAQKAQKAQFLLQFRDEPNVNRDEINKRALSALQVENVDAIIPPQQPLNPEQEALQQEMRSLELRRLRAEVDNLEVDVAQKRSTITKNTADTVGKLKSAEKTIIETDKLEQETYGQFDYSNNSIGNSGMV